MLPSSLGLLLPLFPPARRGAAIGLWSAMGGVAAAFGPPLGGLLVQADWRWVFLVNLPIGVVTVAVGARILHEIREQAGSSPDVLGALGIAATVAAMVAAVVQGEPWGRSSGRVIGLFVLGAAGLAFSVLRMFRHPAPVIEATFLPAGIIAGIGSGLVLPSLSGAATLPLPPERFATGTAIVSMSRQVGLALGVAVVAAILDVQSDVTRFHATWYFMAACGLAGGFILLGIGVVRPGQDTAPDAEVAGERLDSGAALTSG